MPTKCLDAPEVEETRPVELLSRIQAGEAAAWELFERTCLPRLRRWAAECGLQPADCDDVAQEVVVDLLCHPAAFHKHVGASFLGRLRVVAHHKAIDRLRAASREPTGVLGFEALPARSEETTEAVGALDGLATGGAQPGLVEEVRRHFTDVTWRSFVAVALDGRAARDAGADLRLSVGAVRQAVHRVRRMLLAKRHGACP